MSGLILVGASPYYSLNPCCNGIYSMRYLCQVALQQETNCLNPCCNGIYSMSKQNKGRNYKNYKSLNPCCNGIYSMRSMNRWKTKTEKS